MSGAGFDAVSIARRRRHDFFPHAHLSSPLPATGPHVYAHLPRHIALSIDVILRLLMMLSARDTLFSTLRAEATTDSAWSRARTNRSQCAIRGFNMPRYFHLISSITPDFSMPSPRMPDEYLHLTFRYYQRWSWARGACTPAPVYNDSAPCLRCRQIRWFIKTLLMPAQFYVEEASRKVPLSIFWRIFAAKCHETYFTR